MDTAKARVIALLRSFETGDASGRRVLDAESFITHDPRSREGRIDWLDAMAAPGRCTGVRPMRLFRDGSFIFSHTAYDLGGATAGFDIFRFERGRVVEHWNNLQPMPEGRNPSGRSMVDGPATPSDLGRGALNKGIARAFVEQVYVRGQTEMMAGYFHGGQVVQHSAHVADGLAGLSAALHALRLQGRAPRYTRVHMVLGEGNFVLVASEGLLGDQPTAFYDLFRIEANKIVEHWDTVEAIPPAGAWTHPHGKF